MTESTYMHILYVEDDLKLQAQMIKLLNREGHEVTAFADVPRALNFARKTRPDLLLCDYRLEGSLNGLALAKQVRHLYEDCPIVMISSYTTADNVIEALDLDVDAYVKRPVAFDDLLDKLYTADKRRRQRVQSCVASDNLVVDSARRVVTWHGEPLDLTPIELGILTRLVSQPGHVFTPVDLWAAATGERLERQAARFQLKPHLSALRAKLRQGDKYPLTILNMHGQGYRWSEANTPESPRSAD